MTESKNYPEWLASAIKRIAMLQPRNEVISTPERAAEAGVPIGTTVSHMQPYTLRLDPQESLDDHRAMEMIRAGIVDMPLREEVSNG